VFREHLVFFIERVYQLVAHPPMRKYSVVLARLMLQRALAQPNSNRTLEKLA
jgi:hypothetical protein